MFESCRVRQSIQVRSGHMVTFPSAHPIAPDGGRHTMFRLLIGGLGALAIALPAMAQVPPFPASFRTQEIVANGTTIHVRLGGVGPAVLLLHGYCENGDL